MVSSYSSSLITIVPRLDSNSIIEQLQYKHRNSTEICLFLLHLRGVTHPKALDPKHLSNLEDVGIQESTFPAGFKPLLIMTAKDVVSDNDVIENIKNYILPPEFSNVTLIRDVEENEEIQSFRDKCPSSWNLLTAHQMSGSESAVTILYHLHTQTKKLIECHSRARSLLIIVQK